MFVLTSFAFSIVNFNQTKSTAQVESIQELYIFTDSKPLSEYEVLGNVGTTFFVASTQYEKIRNNLIKQTKKKYPHAEGIILKLNHKGVDMCEAIKFK